MHGYHAWHHIILCLLICVSISLYLTNMRSAHVIELVFQYHILQPFHNTSHHNRVHIQLFDRWRPLQWCASPLAIHPQIKWCTRAQCPPHVWQTCWRRGGGAWMSCLTLHLILFNGQFMSSYSVCFKATHVHLHTHVINHSHDAAVCTRHRVHTQPSCTQSHTPWCWKLGAHTVGELVAGSRLSG